MTWVEEARKKATNSAMVPTSELFIDADLTVALEANDTFVALSLFFPKRNAAERSRWDREEVEKIHAALSNWLACGSLT